MSQAGEENKAPRKLKRLAAPRCEDCLYYDTDEDGDYYCTVSMDEDEEYAFRSTKTKVCPYFRFYDEYKSVQKQL